MDNSSHYKSQLRLPRESTQYKKQKKTWSQKWLQRIFCIQSTPNQSTIKLEESDGMLQQPTVKVFKKLYDFDESYSLNEKQLYRIQSSRTKDDFLPFLVQLDKQTITSEIEMYRRTLPIDSSTMVLLLTQTPNLDLIKYLERESLQLIVQLPIKQNHQMLSDYIQDKIQIGAKENKLNEQIPELLFLKVPNYQQIQSIGLFVFQSDDSTQHIIEQTTVLLKYGPSIINRLVFLLAPQCPQSELLKLGSMINNSFFMKFENAKWLQRLRCTSNNRNMVIVRKKENRAEYVNNSQYTLLTTKFQQQLPYVFTMDDFQLVISIIGYNNHKQTVFLTMTTKLIYTQKLNDSCKLEYSRQSIPQNLTMVHYFTNQILFLNQLSKMSQFDEQDEVTLINIVQNASYISCLLCAQILCDEQLSLDQLLRINEHKLYLQILVGCGVLQSESSCQIVQCMLHKYLRIPIMDIQISKNFNYLEQSALQPQYILPSHLITSEDNKGSSFDFQPMSVKSQFPNNDPFFQSNNDQMSPDQGFGMAQNRNRDTGQYQFYAQSVYDNSPLNSFK